MSWRYRTLALIVMAQTLPGCTGESDPHRQFLAGDYASAFKSFSRLADSGDGAAINFVGIHYYLGAGVEQDFVRAAQLFERAALAANADAQRNLGVLYLRGWGVPRNNLHAYGWLYQAYRQGNRRAREYLEMTEHLITPNQSMQARAWIAKRMAHGGTVAPQ